LRWMTVLLVVFAVFSWGVQYKLSLYDRPAKSIAAVPQAKLLSQKERPVAVHQPLAVNASDALRLVPSYFGILFGLILASSMARILQKFGNSETAEFIPLDPGPYLSYFFFRPPPFAMNSH